MIKKIIFDLDNTLLMFDDKQIDDYKNVLKNAGFSCENDEAAKIYKAIGNYELQRIKYDKESLINFINNELGTNYPVSLIDSIIKIIGKNWTNNIAPNLIETLDYLSSKYELYVLTNWFTESQVMRLKGAKIDHYFKEIVGSDMCDIKPNPESYEYFLKDTEPSECLMIGDRPDIDLDGALKIGMNGLLYDYKLKYKDTKYDKFNDWKQIKDIL